MKTVTKKPRKKKQAQYSSFKLSKRIKPASVKPLPSILVLVKQTLLHIWQHKLTFGGILLVYVVLSLIFVKALTSSVDVTSLRNQYAEVLGLSGVVLNSALVADVTSSSTSSDIGSLYQTIIVLITILASIWLFRQTSNSDKTLQIREPFYQGMTPLIPFMMILFVVGLQLLPMIGGVSLFSTVQNNGLAVTGVETMLWALIAICLAMLTFYLLSSSLFALIIVTLPDMRPMTALRSARKLVAFRRWVVMRKLLGVAIICLVIFFGLLLLVIATVPLLAEWLALLLGGVLGIFLSGFGYKLYRALL